MPSLTEAAVVIKNMAYIALVAPRLRRGFVNDAVAERQLLLYSGHPRSSPNLPVGLASDQPPDVRPCGRGPD
jgi:hypothetical protein